MCEMRAILILCMGFLSACADRVIIADHAIQTTPNSTALLQPNVDQNHPAGTSRIVCRPIGDYEKCGEVDKDFLPPPPVTAVPYGTPYLPQYAYPTPGAVPFISGSPLGTCHVVHGINTCTGWPAAPLLGGGLFSGLLVH